jgi:hypothetical protein
MDLGQTWGRFEDPWQLLLWDNNAVCPSKEWPDINSLHIVLLSRGLLQASADTMKLIHRHIDKKLPNRATQRN